MTVVNKVRIPFISIERTNIPNRCHVCAVRRLRTRVLNELPTPHDSIQRLRLMRHAREETWNNLIQRFR